MTYCDIFMAWPCFHSWKQNVFKKANNAWESWGYSMQLIFFCWKIINPFPKTIFKIIDYTALRKTPLNKVYIYWPIHEGWTPFFHMWKKNILRFIWKKNCLLLYILCQIVEQIFASIWKIIIFLMTCKNNKNI